MFENPGGKLKGLALGLFIIEVIAAVIGGLACWIGMGDVEGFFAFVGIIAGGIGVAYVSAIGIYAFGELVENSTFINYKIQQMPNGNTSSAMPQYSAPQQTAPQYNNTPQNSAPITTKYYQNNNGRGAAGSAFWTCPKCHKTNHNTVGTCGCGTRRPN